MAATGVPSLPEVVAFASKDWCTTKVKAMRFQFYWTIDEFSSFSGKQGDKLESSTFPIDPRANQKWRLAVYPYGPLNCKEKDWVSVYLVSCNNEEASAKFKFAILNDRGDQAIIREVTTARRFTSEEPDFGYSQCVKRSSLFDKNLRLLSGDRLSLYCEVSTFADPVTVSGPLDISTPMVSECLAYLSSDMEQLFEDDKFKDVTLSVHGKDFQAHKNILTARSPVFAAMFEHGMKESGENRVVIDDVDYDVLLEMVRYIYTGKVANLKERALGLLAAADKYGIESLRDVCGKELQAQLSKDTAIDILIEADLHSAGELKARALEFMRNHATDFVDSEGCKKMASSYPHLMVELFRSVIVPEGMDCTSKPSDDQLASTS